MNAVAQLAKKLKVRHYVRKAKRVWQNFREHLFVREPIGGVV